VVDVLTAEQLEVFGEAARLVAAQADPVMAAALGRRCETATCAEEPDDSPCLEAG